ncbi:MAG: cobalamin biosynthesis protein P47K, partial [Planctomycetota bacterium]
ISPKTGEGVDQLIDLLFHGGLTQAGQRVLEIDYDTYAEGEAEMGWVNLAGTCQASEAVDLNRLAGEIVEGIRKRVLQRDGQIAHIKTAIMGDGIQAIANVVDPSLPVDEGLSATRPVSGPLQWVVNARVVMDPDALLNECDGAVHDAIASMDNVDDLQTTTRHALRPGRPEPVHRMQ